MVDLLNFTDIDFENYNISYIIKTSYNFEVIGNTSYNIEVIYPIGGLDIINHI